MNNLLRNKRTLYVCKRVMIDDRIFFDKPLKIRANYQPISDKSAGEIIAVGENYINRLILYMTPKVAKNFHNFDRCYVFVDPPKEHDRVCSKADFYVDGTPSQYINESTVHLQRMTGDEQWQTTE